MVLTHMAIFSNMCTYVDIKYSVHVCTYCTLCISMCFARSTYLTDNWNTRWADICQAICTVACQLESDWVGLFQDAITSSSNNLINNKYCHQY